MRIESATMDEVDEVADRWTDLARGQRAHGSHLRVEANRSAIRNAVARDVVTGGVLVARDPELVGFVTFGPESPAYEEDVERGVIRNLYVRPERRGEGVGSALLDAAEERLADTGAEVVSLEAMADNRAARRFYRRNGYSPHRIEFEKRPESDTDTKDDP